MSTDYTWSAPETRCPTCGHHPEPERLDIGSSAMGWVFIVRLYPSHGINSLEDWKPLFARGSISDEYGTIHTAEEMLRRITDRAPANKPPSAAALAASNSAVEHSSGLWMTDPKRVGFYGASRFLRHGEDDGTWEYYLGESEELPGDST